MTTHTDRHFNPARGYPAALLSAAFLSTTAVFIRFLTQTYQMPALVLAFWRDAFVALTLLPVLWLFNRRLLRVDWSHLRYLLLYGLMLALFNALWTLSVAVNGAAVATVLVYSSAAFGVLLGRWLLKEAFNGIKVLSVVVTLAGCVLISNAYTPEAWKVNLLGIALGLLAGLWYAIYSLMGRSAAQRGLNPWTTLLYSFAFAAVFLLVFSLMPGGFLPGAASKPADLFWLGDRVLGWAVLLALAAGPTILGFGTLNVSLTYLPSSIVNLILTIEPVFTAIIAYFLLGERLGTVQIMGSVLVLAGVVFLRLYEGRASSRLEPAPVSSQQAEGD